MMEVDMHSPPSTFRPISFTPVKRSRSPGSPTQERQTKRPTLAPISSEVQGARRASTAPEGGRAGRMAGPDDWVRQAMELSIASPLSVMVGFQSAMGSGGVAQSRTDEHMAVDYEESPQAQALRVHVHPGSSRPWTTRGHLPSIHITTTSTPVQNGLHAPSPAPFSVLTEPPSSSTESLSSTGSVAGAQRPCPPDIFLFPATPSDTPSHQSQFAAEGEAAAHSQMQDQGLSQSTLTRGLQDRIDGSPRPSRTLDVPTTIRKHRVTMGPRADCVKCRTGVRGHWMHFD